jgi:hypothetical protein
MCVSEMPPNQTIESNSHVSHLTSRDRISTRKYGMATGIWCPLVGPGSEEAPGAFPISCYLSGGNSHNKTSGSFVALLPQSANAIPFQLSHTFRLIHDSGGIRVLRFLVGCRHFSNHAKANLHQVRM